MSHEVETKTKKWFRENVVENAEDLRRIGGFANRILHDKLNMGINDDETTIAIYGIIFETFAKSIAKKETEYNDFKANIAGRLEIGYTTTDNEDDEKSGNFMVYMRNIQNDTASDDSVNDDNDSSTIELCTEWNAANIKVQADFLKECAAEARKKLGEYINLKIDSHEFIIPVFCIVHSQILKYLKVKRVEEGKTEFEINIAGLYIAGVEETDDAEEEIYFIPSIALKLMFKNDSLASSED